MRIQTCALVLLAAVMTAGEAGAAWPAALGRRPLPASLTCADFDKDGPAAHERRALRAAPEGATRESDHALAVNTRGGVRRFVDKKPYREELDGFHWSYCGYIPVLGAHLIGMEQDSLFSGKLLLDGDGRVLDAGQTVYPSPDGRLFLAESQVDGEDLSHWVLSDLAGRRLWAGLSGAGGAEDIQVEYGNPRWISDDAIQATAVCGARPGSKGRATLVRAGKSWRWKSDLRCGR